MCVNCIDFRRGDKFPELVLLGACPGKDESNANPPRPFAGRSASNLKILLGVLRDLPNKDAYGFQHDDFASDNLDDYTLMNSHAEAKWKAKDGRTTPRMSEVEKCENLRRLSNQLRSVNARVVIGLGRPNADDNLDRTDRDSSPMRAIRNLKAGHPEVSFCITAHPSPISINTHGKRVLGEVNAPKWFRQQLHRFP